MTAVLEDLSPTAGKPIRSSGREQAVGRRLDPVRARAEERVQRFLEAALEVMSKSASGRDFTVQEVVERSGQSFRSFYTYFGGKQELLLALFEEDLRSTTRHLRAFVAQESSSVERLHQFVVEYHRLCRPAPRRRGGTKNWPSPVITEFAQHLFTTRPAEAGRAFVPLVELFEELLADAESEGFVQSGLGRRRMGVILEAVMFNVFSRTIVGSSGQDDGDPAEELWDIFLHGISA